MFRNAFLIFFAVLIAGCSAIDVQSLPGSMDRLGNSRYGYALLVPSKWSQQVNSNIRPTELTLSAPKIDAEITLTVIEGGKAPEMEAFSENLGNLPGVESFTLIRQWRTYFNDMVGYICNFKWKGKIRIFDKTVGKPGKEYMASVAVVERDPSPIIYIAFAPEENYEELDIEYFNDSRSSLMVQPVELTVREVEGK